MKRKILVLGASYGSLLGMKLAMAGHDVDLVCRAQTAEVINRDGALVRLKLRDEPDHRVLSSNDQPGTIRAMEPQDAVPNNYDLIALAMQEPQYSAGPVRILMAQVAASGVPCLSIMNMPPLPYLKRMEGLDHRELEAAFADPRVWDGFDPGLMSLCSPDPQAFRPPDEPINLLHVGLPTNFKAAVFASPAHNQMLRDLEADIAAVRLDGKDVPVKLRVFESLFVPLAKWSMLLTGNYRCVQDDGAIPIKDAVHGDIEKSREIYEWVDALARDLGADPSDQVPFEKYAKAAEGLLKPSSAARAIEAGVSKIERVDRLVREIARQKGQVRQDLDTLVARIDNRLDRNSKAN